MKFCGNCGVKISIETNAPKFEALVLLHLAASLYLVISLIFNTLVQMSSVFIVPYVASSLLGLFAAYSFYRGKTSKSLKAISALAIAIGLAFTFTLFVIGASLIGPAWIIFVINGWALWKQRRA